MTTEAPLACWRCEQPGHVAAECQPPPARTKNELYQRIDRLVDRWIAGDIRPEQKQQWITAEVKAFEKARGK